MVDTLKTNFIESTDTTVLNCVPANVDSTKTVLSIIRMLLIVQSLIYIIIIIRLILEFIIISLSLHYLHSFMILNLLLCQIMNYSLFNLVVQRQILFILLLVI